MNTRIVLPSMLIMSKNSVEWVMLLILFVASFFHTTLLFLFMIALVFLSKQKEVGALKVIVLLTIRTIISPSIAVGISSFQYLKIVLLIGCSIYLITSFFKLKKKHRNKINGIVVGVIFFTIYNILVAFFISTLPIVATMKVIFYSVVFLGVLIGVARTIEEFNIFNWTLKWFKLIMIVSLLTIPFPLAYLNNGRAFQGIINHPNMFGVVSVIFIAMLLSRRINKSNLFFIVIAFLMVILSDSRTSFISSIVIFVIYIISHKVKKLTYLKLASTSFLSIAIVLLYRPILEFLVTFLAKGQDLSNILYSRESQISNLMFHFQQSPIFGNGFSVPVMPYRSYEFSMDYIVEPGNLILALLSFSGIVGFLIFTIYMLQILLSNKNNLFKRLYLYIAPIMISMGEMVFFSSNSIGPLCYLLLAMYMFIDNDSIENNRISYSVKNGHVANNGGDYRNLELLSKRQRADKY